MSKSAVFVAVLIAAGVLVAGFVGGTPAADSQESAPTAVYKGSKACKACHSTPHKAWGEMKHSVAFASLSAEQVASGKDPKGRACISCHSTGFGEPGGFVSMEKTPKLANVGCESCHGAGSEHVKLMLNLMMEEREPSDDMEKHISKSVGCVKCHNPHISYKKLYGTD